MLILISSSDIIDLVTNVVEFEEILLFGPNWPKYLNISWCQFKKMIFCILFQLIRFSNCAKFC